MLFPRQSHQGVRTGTNRRPENRRVTREIADSPPTSDKLLDVQAELIRLYSEVRGGETSPKTAATLASLLSLLDRVNQAAEIKNLQRAYAALQKEVSERVGGAAGTDDKPDALHIPSGDLPEEPKV